MDTKTVYEDLPDMCSQSLCASKGKCLAEVICWHGRCCFLCKCPQTQLCGTQVTLLKLLTAYEAILRREGLSTADDVRLYSFLLQLSLGNEPDWGKRFERLRQLQTRQGVAAV